MEKNIYGISLRLSKGILLSLVALLALPLVAFAQTSAPDFTQYGFPKVIASMKLQPGQAATIGSGQVQAIVPAKAFTDPVQFELLEGNNSTFQPYAPAGQTVIANFAFRVTDLKTGQRLAKFNAPIVVVITDSMITAQSRYLDTTPTHPIQIKPNPIAPQISGHVLKHGNIGDPVGWVVTSPTASIAQVPSTMPSTGAGGLATTTSAPLLLLTLFLSITLVGMFSRQAYRS